MYHNKITLLLQKLPNSLPQVTLFWKSLPRIFPPPRTSTAHLPRICVQCQNVCRLGVPFLQLHNPASTFWDINWNVNEPAAWNYRVTTEKIGNMCSDYCWTSASTVHFELHHKVSIAQNFTVPTVSRSFPCCQWQVSLLLFVLWSFNERKTGKSWLTSSDSSIGNESSN